MALETYLTANELASSLRMSRRHVYSLVKRGILPKGVRLGHSRRWSVNDIQTALESMKGEMK